MTAAGFLTRDCRSLCALRFVIRTQMRVCVCACGHVCVYVCVHIYRCVYMCVRVFVRVRVRVLWLGGCLCVRAPVCKSGCCGWVSVC